MIEKSKLKIINLELKIKRSKI